MLFWKTEVRGVCFPEGSLIILAIRCCCTDGDLNRSLVAALPRLSQGTGIRRLETDSSPPVFSKNKIRISISGTITPIPKGDLSRLLVVVDIIKFFKS